MKTILIYYVCSFLPKLEFSYHDVVMCYAVMSGSLA